MVRYFYAWGPLVVIGTVLFLSLPWLGLFALVFFAFVAFVALATLAWATVLVPYKLSRSISGHWHGRTVVSPRTAAALVPNRRQSA